MCIRDSLYREQVKAYDNANYRIYYEVTVSCRGRVEIENFIAKRLASLSILERQRLDGVKLLNEICEKFTRDTPFERQRKREQLLGLKAEGNPLSKFMDTMEKFNISLQNVNMEVEEQELITKVKMEMAHDIRYSSLYAYLYFSGFSQSWSTLKSMIRAYDFDHHFISGKRHPGSSNEKQKKRRHSQGLAGKSSPVLNFLNRGAKNDPIAVAPLSATSSDDKTSNIKRSERTSRLHNFKPKGKKFSYKSKSTLGEVRTVHSDKKERLCFNCKSNKHIARDCPVRAKAKNIPNLSTAVPSEYFSVNQINDSDSESHCLNLAVHFENDVYSNSPDIPEIGSVTVPEPSESLLYTPFLPTIIDEGSRAVSFPRQTIHARKSGFKTDFQLWEPILGEIHMRNKFVGIFFRNDGKISQDELISFVYDNMCVESFFDTISNSMNMNGHHSCALEGNRRVAIFNHVNKHISIACVHGELPHIINRVFLEGQALSTGWENGCTAIPLAYLQQFRSPLYLLLENTVKEKCNAVDMCTDCAIEDRSKMARGASEPPCKKCVDVELEGHTEDSCWGDFCDFWEHPLCRLGRCQLCISACSDDTVKPYKTLQWGIPEDNQRILFFSRWMIKFGVSGDILKMCSHNLEGIVSDIADPWPMGENAITYIHRTRTFQFVFLPGEVPLIAFYQNPAHCLCEFDLFEGLVGIPLSTIAYTLPIAQRFHRDYIFHSQTGARVARSDDFPENRKGERLTVEDFLALRQEFNAIEEEDLDFDTYKRLQLGRYTSPPPEFFLHTDAYNSEMEGTSPVPILCANVFDSDDEESTTSDGLCRWYAHPMATAEHSSDGSNGSNSPPPLIDDESSDESSDEMDGSV